jgi:hypothetical protein
MDFQLITLREELSRLHQDNRKLRSMLDQVTKNYSELHGQLLMGMQKQAHQNRQEQVNIYMFFLFFFFFLISRRSHKLELVIYSLDRGLIYPLHHYFSSTLGLGSIFIFYFFKPAVVKEKRNVLPLNWKVCFLHRLSSTFLALK